MLSAEDFQAFAKDNLLYLHVTSRVEGAAHPNQLQEKGGRGFPYVVALDSRGDVIANLSDRSVEGFQSMLKDGGDFLSLLKKDKRTPGEEIRLLGLEMGMGRVKGDEARTRANALKDLDAEGVKARDEMLLGLDIQQELDTIKGPDPSPRIAAGRKFAEMWSKGRAPGGTDDRFQPFYIFILDHAESVRDAALFGKALKVLKDELQEKYRDNPGAVNFFKKQDGRLEALSEKGDDDGAKDMDDDGDDEGDGDDDDDDDDDEDGDEDGDDE